VQEFTGIEEEGENFTWVALASRDDNDSDDTDAMDYTDIDEMAEDEEQKEKHYQLGMKYIDNKAMAAGEYVYRVSFPRGVKSLVHKD